MTWAEQDALSPGQESLDEAESHGPAGHGAMEEGTRVVVGTWCRWRETQQVRWGLQNGKV